MLDLNSRIDQCSLLRFKKGGEQENILAQQAIAYLLKSFKKNKYNSESAKKNLCQALRFQNHASPCVTIHGMFMVSIMAVWVVEFSNGGYKIRKIFV